MSLITVPFFTPYEIPIQREKSFFTDPKEEARLDELEYLEKLRQEFIIRYEERIKTFSPFTGKTILNPRAPNGGGKGVCPGFFVACDPKGFYVKDDKEIALTVLPSWNLTLIGQYNYSFYKKEFTGFSGGCDRINKLEEMRKYVHIGLKEFPNYTLLFEGIIISSGRSSASQFLTDLQKEYGRTGFQLYPQASYETLLKRIGKRKGLDTPFPDAKGSVIAKYKQLKKQPGFIVNEYPEIRIIRYESESRSIENIIKLYQEVDKNPEKWNAGQIYDV